MQLVVNSHDRATYVIKTIIGYASARCFLQTDKNNLASYKQLLRPHPVGLVA
jgi:hypothetical protein